MEQAAKYQLFVSRDSTKCISSFDLLVIFTGNRSKDRKLPWMMRGELRAAHR